MAQNLIRARQINQSDLTGVVQGVIDANEFSLNYNGGTGFNIDSVAAINISGTTLNIYDTPINISDDFNLSGLGYFNNALNLNNIDSVVFSGVDINIIKGTISADNIIYNTGNQTVSGNVVVASGIYAQYVYGTGVYGANLVYNTGDQNISGTKIFKNFISFQNNEDNNLPVSIGGNTSGISISNFNKPLNITFTKNTNIGSINEIISINNSDTSKIFSESINGTTDSIIIYGTGLDAYGNYLLSPYLRLGRNNIISEGTGRLGIGTTFPTEKVHISGGNLRLDFGSGIFSLSGARPLVIPNNPLSIVGSGNTYLQLNIQNRATGTTATADLVITANNGTDSSNYINLGINNSGYNDPAFSNGTGLDGYLFINGGNLDIGTQTLGKDIEFHVGGTTVDKIIAKINESGLNILSGTYRINNIPYNTNIITFLSSNANLSVGHNYISNLGGGYSATQSDRLVPIIDACTARKASITLLNQGAGNNILGITGYFINTSSNPPQTGTISSSINASVGSTQYSYTGNFSTPITISAGDNVVCSLFSNNTAVNVRTIATIYLYN